MASPIPPGRRSVYSALDKDGTPSAAKPIIPGLTKLLGSPSCSQRLHECLDRMHADLSAHVLTHDGREPVMETRKNQRPAAQPEACVPQRLDKNAKGLEIHRLAVDAAAHQLTMSDSAGRRGD